ncbi:MAG: ParA family protein [Thermoguttaceae bacterium]|nr:ParA family protein [Thermoguttaceae bacterium]
MARSLKRLEEEARCLVGHTQENEELFDQLIRREGSVWAVPVAEKHRSQVYPFVPKQERPERPGGRTMRVVSLINLKGGVGKTTLCGNLAAAFGAANYNIRGGNRAEPLKVLMIDLDFQGTLSQRCVRPDTLRHTYQSGLTSRVLLSGAAKSKGQALAVPCVGSGSVQVIPADDPLDGEDFRHQAMLALGIKETRFLYRRLLFKPNFMKQCDLVLIDCPPRLTSSTVCSLVASDYVLVPTAPDEFDFPAVQRTLHWIGNMRQALSLPVKLAGIALNRTSKATALGAREEAIKTRLNRFVTNDIFNSFPDLRGAAAPAVFDSYIPRRTGDNNSINGKPNTPLPGTTADWFHDLASELYERIF